ncbi:hypothetical protein GGR10_000510 [Bartonella chomelii]|uniref:Uncharacterized protein n=3 Tax=Bartonellaceae TaxID=772 RepID=N6V9X9_9HYPH|nr:hypothetical protein m07a_12010 [Bartonella schoenbuchensis m07a]MBA9082669.1 hypothetical protein [Bartonella chomelii]
MPMTIPAVDTHPFDFKSGCATTFSRMVELIQDEIDDTTGEYCVQIYDSICAALRICEREPFFFNEHKEVTFKTRSGQTWYGQEDDVLIKTVEGLIKTVGALEGVFLEHGGATRTQLIYKTAKTLQKDYGSNPPQGMPVFYTYCQRKIGLFPTPETVGTVRLSYSALRFVEGGMEGEDHPWFVHAFDFIKARAKYELYKNILKDPECAAVSLGDFQEQLQILRYETSRKKGCSQIAPTGF